MKEKLLNCPFCGRKPDIEQYRDWGWRISCCLMIAADHLYKSRYLAIKAWNGRPK